MRAAIHVVCRCLYGPGPCKLSNANKRRLQCCCVNTIVVLLPVQPNKHWAAALSSEKNTDLVQSHFFRYFAKPVEPVPDKVHQTPSLGNIVKESCKKYDVTKLESWFKHFVVWFFKHFPAQKQSPSACKPLLSHKGLCFEMPFNNELPWVNCLKDQFKQDTF